MPVNYLKKESFTGSYQGMRFKMLKAQVMEGEEEKTVLRVIHWPEPYGFDATGEEYKVVTEVAFNEEGIQAGIAWLNQEYERCYAHGDFTGGNEDRLPSDPGTAQ